MVFSFVCKVIMGFVGFRTPEEAFFSLSYEEKAGVLQPVQKFFRRENRLLFPVPPGEGRGEMPCLSGAAEPSSTAG